MLDVRYLLTEEIVAIHDRMLAEIGGRKGIRDVNLLYSIAERPKMAIMGDAFYLDLFSKAAAIFEALATYHVFIDGNKRTAFIAASLFLQFNGFRLRVSKDRAYAFILEVALKKKSIEEIARWLKKHSRIT